MRKISVVLAVAAMCTATVAHAEVGDIAGTIYTTDILTQVDGRDITSYSIDGKTLIALEDLKDYGFNVYYNDNIRSVFVTKTGEVSPDFKPSVERGKVGGKAGYYYETDIQAYLNGKWIQAYAIDGKMVACVEEMGDTRYTQFGNRVYQMGYTYNDTNRLLSLNTDPSEFGGGYREIVKNVLNPGSYYWSPNRGNCLHEGDTFFAPYWLGGLPHGGSAIYYTVVRENGLSYDVQAIARLYWLDINEPVLSDDGKILYFINYENDRAEYKMIELDSLHVAPAQKIDYDAAATVRENDFKAIFNGSEIPLYNIGGGDYINPDELNNEEISILKDSGDAKTAYILRENDFKAIFNGSEIPLYNIGGGDYINPDELNNEEISILKDSGDAKTAYIYGNAVRLIPLSMLEYNNDDYKQTEIVYEYDIENKRVILTTKDE